MTSYVGGAGSFVAALGERAVVVDGGLSEQLAARGNDLSDALWSARLLADAPGEVVAAHRAYYAAGAEVAITASYQATFEGFARRGVGRVAATRLLGDSVGLARRAADEAREADGVTGPLWVAASAGPYGAMLADGSEYRGRYGLSVAELERFHRPRLEVLAAAGPDVLALETVPDADEARALLRAVRGSGCRPGCRTRWRATGPAPVTASRTPSPWPPTPRRWSRSGSTAAIRGRWSRRSGSPPASRASRWWPTRTVASAGMRPPAPGGAPPSPSPAWPGSGWRPGPGWSAAAAGWGPRRYGRWRARCGDRSAGSAADSFKTGCGTAAYSHAMSTQTPGRVRFDALGIATTDLTASLAFYRRLGLEFPEGAERAPHVEAQVAGGIRLMWDVVPAEEAPAGGGGPQLAFLCDSPAGVDALYAELTGAGYRGTTPPWDAVWGQRYAVVADPDGNGVDLFAPLEAS